MYIVNYIVYCNLYSRIYGRFFSRLEKYRECHQIRNFQLTANPTTMYVLLLESNMYEFGVMYYIFIEIYRL